MEDVVQYLFHFLLVIIVGSLLAFLVGMPKVNQAIQIFIRMILVVASIVLYSIVAYVYFLIGSFLFPEPLYYVNGTGLDQANEEMILKLSITFAIVYYIALLISHVLIGKCNFAKWKSKVLTNIILLIIVIFTYTLVIYKIFPSFTISFKGHISLIFLVVFIWVLQSPFFKRRVFGGSEQVSEEESFLLIMIITYSSYDIKGRVSLRIASFFHNRAI